MGIPAESLESGKVLAYLIKDFTEKRTKESLISVLRCLRDSLVWLPVDKEDKEAGPDILKNSEGRLFLPVFSQKEQIPRGYSKRFSFVKLRLVACIELAEGLEGVESIVVDPFTGNFILLPELMEVVMKLPSELEE